MRGLGRGRQGRDGVALFFYHAAYLIICIHTTTSRPPDLLQLTCKVAKRRHKNEFFTGLMNELLSTSNIVNYLTELLNS